MDRITKNTRKEIEGILAKSRFTKHAFDLWHWTNDFEVTSDPPPPLFKITFLHDPEYFFEVRTESNVFDENDFYFKIKGAPGHRLHDFNVTLGQNAWSELFDAIMEWVQRVDSDADLQTDASVHIEAIKQKLEEQLRQDPESSEGIFSSDEIESILRHLRKIEADYKALKDQASLNDEKIKEFENKIAFLETQLEIVTRGTWYRLYIHQMLDVAEGLWHSPPVRKLLFEASRTAVQEGVKGLLGSGNS